MDYTQEQIEKLKSLGIDVKTENRPVKGDVPTSVGTEGLKTENLEIGNLSLEIKPKKTNNVFPLLSISGLTLLSFSGLILLKNNSAKQNNTVNQENSKIENNSALQEPTQVPKSIQHYLLTSQQLFSSALQMQSTIALPKPTGEGGPSEILDLINKSILAATDAIKEFPNDYRGYQQRGKIYQALIESKPDLINQSISDISSALKLNPSSPEISHTLASLYAKKGDTQNTILYLNQTVALEPTKAQHFYDLAKIQQQAGFLSQALETYNQLATLVTDPTQKSQVETEKLALQKLIAQNPRSSEASAKENQILPTINDPQSTINNLDSPTIQALAEGGLIIAAPEESNKIQVTNQTDSNSFSGNSILPSGQKEITITNNNISSTSPVYVTATKGGKNQNLQVLSKSTDSFTVGLNSPISEDIEFKWWIIN